MLLYWLLAALLASAKCDQIRFNARPARPEQPLRIGIIGAGAAGSSASYFLRHFKDHAGLDTQMSIYDSNDYVGGRSTVVKPWLDNPELWSAGNGDDEEGVECGASIFIEANENMMKAARVFNLTLKNPDGEEGGASIWDGEQFVWVESKGWGYWDLAKMFWRYGRSPLTVRNLVKQTVASFSTLYSESFASLGAWRDIYAFASAVNLTEAAATTAGGFFANKGVAPLFTHELVGAATAVNYAQRTRDIHGVGALVSLAPNGASTVVGGNRQIFEQFVARGGAKVHLGKQARVQSLTKLDADGSARPQWVIKTPSGGATFDAVILAAPLHQTGISFLGTDAPSKVPKQRYVRLHVTFVITNATSPSPAYFNQKGPISKAIFATFDTESSKKPAFNSLNYLKPLSDSIGTRFGEGTMHVIKMFSYESLSHATLESIFGESNVRKSWEKVWHSYPYLEPISSPQDLAPVELEEGLYYVNAFERVISTMETEIIASFNVVSLLLKDFFDYQPPRSWPRW